MNLIYILIGVSIALSLFAFAAVYEVMQRLHKVDQKLCITGDNPPDPDCLNCGGDGILNAGEGQLFETPCFCTFRVEACQDE